MQIENEIVRGLITFFLILIPIGAGVRITFCAIGSMSDEEKTGEYKRRGKNALLFAVVAELLTGLVALFLSYYQ